MKCIVSVIVSAHLISFIGGCKEPTTTTVHIQNYDGPIYVHGDNCSPTLTTIPSTCDNCNPTLINPASTFDNRYPTLTGLTSTYNNRLPTLSCLPNCDNQSPILHSSTVPYQQTICETDCKCVTKHQTPCIPINSIQQNTCTPVYYCTQCPEGYYYGYSDSQSYGSETDASCPRISETLIPLLKTYLTQGGGKCPKHSSQCGRQY